MFHSSCSCVLYSESLDPHKKPALVKNLTRSLKICIRIYEDLILYVQDLHPFLKDLVGSFKDLHFISISRVVHIMLA